MQRFVLWKMCVGSFHGDEMQIEIRSPFKIHFSTFMRRLACFLSTELFYIIPIVHFSLHAKIPGWPASLHQNIDESEDLPPHLDGSYLYSPSQHIGCTQGVINFDHNNAQRIWNGLTSKVNRIYYCLILLKIEFHGNSLLCCYQ